MPPDLCIPPHHDTGFWVHHTHRIHVPIITEPDSVVFAVGPTVETMKRYRLEEGCIAELNNQAKHAVHNCWDHYRTHLIFDYVEDYPMPRMKLKVKGRSAAGRKGLIESLCMISLYGLNHIYEEKEGLQRKKRAYRDSSYLLKPSFQLQ